MDEKLPTVSYCSKFKRHKMIMLPIQIQIKFKLEIKKNLKQKWKYLNE